MQLLLAYQRLYHRRLASFCYYTKNDGLVTQCTKRLEKNKFENFNFLLLCTQQKIFRK